MIAPVGGRWRSVARLLVAMIPFVPTASASQVEGGQAPLVDQVDPFVGADRDGNTVPGAKVPFGFANPSPDTVPATQFRFDTSGYQSDQPIVGFSQTHVSGTGGEGKYGNFRITPSVGPVKAGPGASAKAHEVASPGYYSVHLTQPDVRVELTATRLVAVHRYTFPAVRQANLLIDTGSVIVTGGGEGRRQRPIHTRTKIVAPDRIEGSADILGGWNPSPYTLHFVAQFSRPATAFGTWRDSSTRPGTTAITGEQGGAGAYLTFDGTADPTVEVKVALSFVSIEKAAANLIAETAGADFDSVRSRAGAAWEDALSRIRVEGGNEAERRIFYTALYRSQYMPHDLTGENAWWRSKEPHYEDYYALWDTFRTVHPLLTLIQRDRQRDMVRSLIDSYRHTGWLPDARIAGANGMMQGGTSADILIADAFVKGLDGIDYAIAYRAMLKNADVDSPRPSYEGRELGDYLRLGYLSSDYERSASRTLEYAYGDFAIAQLADGLGRPGDRDRLLARSRGWRKLWDRESLSIRPRGPDGRWMTPFDPTRLYMLDAPRFTWMSAPYYEGSAYQYSTFVPHDVVGLIEAVGGRAAFVAWLDAFFGSGGSGRALRPEGLYSHVNEPDILAAYLYIHAGRPDLTQARVRTILASEYGLGRGGLPGNDDAGTISAWYVWSAMGLYPNAGQDLYYIGSPLFSRASIALGEAGKLVIRAEGARADRPYVKSATLNGKPLERAWLRHSEIVDGGELDLVMDAEPTHWGQTNLPPVGSK